MRGRFNNSNQSSDKSKIQWHNCKEIRINALWDEHKSHNWKINVAIANNMDIMKDDVNSE